MAHNGVGVGSDDKDLNDTVVGDEEGGQGEGGGQGEEEREMVLSRDIVSNYTDNQRSLKTIINETGPLFSIDVPLLGLIGMDGVECRSIALDFCMHAAVSILFVTISSRCTFDITVSSLFSFNITL